MELEDNESVAEGGVEQKKCCGGSDDGDGEDDADDGKKV